MKLILITFLSAAVLGLSHGQICTTRNSNGINNRTPQYLRHRGSNDRRIVGGEDANIADHPHMLALIDLNLGSFVCGASAVNPLWAMTAAHCLEFGSLASHINLRGGSTNRAFGGEIFFAEWYYCHPEYDPIWLDNDIGLISISPERPIQGVNIQIIPISPICATNCCEVCEDENDLVTITGWGRNSIGILPLTLQQISLPIYNQEACNTAWGGTIGPVFFCIWAGDGKDSCNGDSGSPVTRIVNNARIQVGVVSFGSVECGDGSGPSANVRIEEPGVRNWVRDVSGI